MRRNSFWNEFDFVLKDPKSPQLRRLGSGPFHLFKAEVKLGKRKPFVCVSSFTPKWHRKNTREHFQIGKTPIQQRQKFHERSGCQTSCLAQVCQRKKSEADFEISHGSGALGASAAVVRWRMFRPSRPQRIGLILTMGTWDRCFMMAFYRLMPWDLNV